MSDRPIELWAIVKINLNDYLIRTYLQHQNDRIQFLIQTIFMCLKISYGLSEMRLSFFLEYELNVQDLLYIVLLNKERRNR